jgi:hypothetical protein
MKRMVMSMAILAMAVAVGNTATREGQPANTPVVLRNGGIPIWPPWPSPPPPCQGSQSDPC